jgi:putative transposase
LNPISFKRHRFPPDVIRYAVWLYFRFMLSIRDVEDLLAQRGIEVSREAVRCWANKFGPLIAANLRRRRSPPTGRWHLDEMVVRIGGRRMYLWRAVDDEGEVLDMLVQRRRNKHAALKLLRKLLKNQGVHPETITTDKLASYGAAAKLLGLTDRHRPGGMRETIGPRTRTWLSADESESSRSSNRRAQPRGSCPRTPPSTIRSISSSI